MKNIVMTGAMYEMVQPIAWDIQSDRAVPKASRRMRVFATSARAGNAVVDVDLVGIRQDAADANVDCAERIEDPAVARVDECRHLRTDLQFAHLLG